MNRLRIAVLFAVLGVASGASGQTLRITNVSIPDTVDVRDGVATTLPVQVRVYRDGVTCIRTPCQQAPPLRARLHLAVEIDSVSSASVRSGRTFRAHSSHTLAVPLAVDFVGHTSGGAERVLWGTVRLFQNGRPADCQRFQIVVNAPEAPRRSPLPQAQRRCSPSTL